MSDELLPCPFCGGEAVAAQTTSRRRGEPAVDVFCRECGARAPKEWWNTRAEPAGQAGLRSNEGWRPLDEAPSMTPLLVRYHPWNTEAAPLAIHVAWYCEGAWRPYPKTADEGDEAWAVDWKPMPNAALFTPTDEVKHG